MNDIKTLLILIPLLPLTAAGICACFGRLLKGASHWPVIVALGAAFLASMALLKEVNSSAEHGRHAAGQNVGYEETFVLWRWASVADAYPANIVGHDGQAPPTSVPAQQPRSFTIDLTLRADPLTSIMLAMVTFIATLVAIYAAGYMHGDPGYWRFFSYVGLFVFSMTMLVSVSNFALLYVFWEAVGLCSYLLIGFWYQKPEAAAAGKKAFLVNRVGDFGFALGLFLIWCTYGTLNFHDTPATDAQQTSARQAAADNSPADTAEPASVGVLGQTRLSMPGGSGYVGGAVGTAICLLLLLGACGKSAQFPLHVWLPDAMEGPTPVSALIHAATMVTAGVYMVTRCAPLFFAAPSAENQTAMQVVALVGCFTALLAGLIAITQNDLKRVLAYSTISQLGYMFLSVGAGVLPGTVFGMFHLFTHAFFKALLFLGAGSVMHAMGGVIDMRKFSGLRRIMPITFWTFLIGCLALSGVTPFAGFWSKDSILAVIYQRGQETGGPDVFGIAGLTAGRYYFALYIVAMATAGLTALYTFRAFFMTFFGPLRVPQEAGSHAHESPLPMTLPLMILAVCATVVGFSLVSGFSDFIKLTPSLSWAPMIPSESFLESLHEHHDLIGVTSTVVAISGIGIAAFLYLGDQTQVAWLRRHLGPAYALSAGKFFFDQIYTLLIIWPLQALAFLSNFVDTWVVDGLVNFVGAIPPFFGRMIRSVQNGILQFYALAMVLGLLVLIAALVAWPK